MSNLARRLVHSLRVALARVLMRASEHVDPNVTITRYDNGTVVWSKRSRKGPQ